MASTDKKAEFYICVSIHEASSDAQDFSPLYEERLTLIIANSKEEATHKAQRMVKGAVHTYQNKDGNSVTWKCRRIVNVTEMVDSAIADGAEISGRYFHNLAAYESFESDLKGRP